MGNEGRSVCWRMENWSKFRTRYFRFAFSLFSASLALLATDSVESALNRHGEAREKYQDWSVCSDQKSEKITSRT